MTKYFPSQAPINISLILSLLFFLLAHWHVIPPVTMFLVLDTFTASQVLCAVHADRVHSVVFAMASEPQES
jgi:hypothetical protein